MRRENASDVKGVSRASETNGKPKKHAKHAAGFLPRQGLRLWKGRLTHLLAAVAVVHAEEGGTVVQIENRGVRVLRSRRGGKRGERLHEEGRRRDLWRSRESFRFGGQASARG